MPPFGKGRKTHRRSTFGKRVAKCRLRCVPGRVRWASCFRSTELPRGWHAGNEQASVSSATLLRLPANRSLCKCPPSTAGKSWSDTTLAPFLLPRK